MKTTQVTIILVLAALVAGATVEHLRMARKLSHAKVESAPAVVAPLAQNGVANHNNGESAGEALRKRIAELERSLTTRQQQIDELQRAIAARDSQMAQLRGGTAPTTENGEPTPRPQRQPRETYADRMERLRTENPEEFANIERRRTEMRERMNNLAQERKDFLAAIDTKGMSAEQLENHQKLVNAVALSENMANRFTDGQNMNLNDEERRNVFETVRSIGSLYEQERRYLLEETGRALGEDGKNFADYVQNIYDNTSLMPRMGGWQRGGRGTTAEGGGRGATGEGGGGRQRQGGGERQPRNGGGAGNRNAGAANMDGN